MYIYGHCINSLPHCCAQKDVRSNFPVPPAFAFGVPTDKEGGLLACDFLPLLLLNVDDHAGPTLVQRPSEQARVLALELGSESESS